MVSISGENRTPTDLSGAKPIRRNVEGAPYKIGVLVSVERGSDETFNPGYLGMVGTVVHFDYSCGCGQTYPSDPMVGVMFSDSIIEEFWKEELDLLFV